MHSESTLSPLALITGASSEIGLAIAKQFAAHGYDLLITGNGAIIHAVAEELRDEGVNVDVSEVDLADEEGVDELMMQVHSDGRSVSALAINAEVGEGGAFVESFWNIEKDALMLNLVSTVHLTKQIAKDMLRRKKGRILFTASLAPGGKNQYEAVYSATKAFLYSFSESLHEEFKGRGVVVTALMPGPSHSTFFHPSGFQAGEVIMREKFKLSSSELAEQGFNALMRGEENVIAAAIKAKIEGSLNRILPKSFKSFRNQSNLENPSSHRH